MNVEEIRLLLDNYHSVDEGNKFTWKRNLQQADAYLDERLKSGERSADLLLLAAEVAATLRDWDTVLERAASVLKTAELGSPTRHRALALLVSSHSALENLSKAREYFHQLQRESPNSALLSHDTVARLDDAQRQSESERAYIALCEEGISFAAVGKKAEAVDRFTAAVALQHPESQDLDALQPVVETVVDLLTVAHTGVLKLLLGKATGRACWLRGAAGSPTSEQAGRTGAFTTQVVVTSGFGWSGSGAVTDLLKGSNRVEMPLSEAELPWFTLAWSVVVAAGRFGFASAKVARELGCFLAATVLGVPITTKCSEGVVCVDTTSTKAVKIRKASLVGVFLRNGFVLGQLSSATHALVAKAGILGRRLFVGDLENALRTFFGEIIDAGSTRADAVCLINNAIKPKRLDHLKLLPNSTAVVVLRDPRDQFVTRHLMDGKQKSISRDVRRFVESFKNRYVAYTALFDDPAVATAITEIQFEELVFQEDTRARLIADLGLTNSMETQSGTLKPSESQNNVGIHHSFEDQEAIRFIESQLGDHLSPISQQHVPRFHLPPVQG